MSLRYYDTRTLAQLQRYPASARGSARHQEKTFWHARYPHLAERSGPGSQRVASAAVVWRTPLHVWGAAPVDRPFARRRTSQRPSHAG